MSKKSSLKQLRVFSEDIRKEVVRKVENGEFTVSQAAREYSISSNQTIYAWLYRYSRTLKKGTRLVMEKDSLDQSNEALKKKIKELEAALGRKSLEADLYRIMIEEASKEFKVDIKKNFGGEPSEDPKS
jgi:transposase-like protein